MYSNQIPNMYPFQSTNNYIQPNQLIRVTGLEGAKAYQMGANSTAALFDSGSDLMYIKSTDGACFPTIRTFKFEEVHNDTPTQREYVSKEEFEEFKKEIRENVEQSIQRYTTNNQTYIDGDYERS